MQKLVVVMFAHMHIYSMVVGFLWEGKYMLRNESRNAKNRFTHGHVPLYTTEVLVFQ